MQRNMNKSNIHIQCDRCSWGIRRPAVLKVVLTLASQSGTQRPHSASIISTTSAGLTTLGKEGQANATVGFTLPPPPSTSRPLTGAAATCAASTTRGTVGGTSVGLPNTPTTATQQHNNTKRLRSTSPVSTMGTVSTLPDVAASSATEEETLGGTGKEATEGPELTVSFLCRRYPGVCQAAGTSTDARAGEIGQRGESFAHYGNGEGGVLMFVCGWWVCLV